LTLCLLPLRVHNLSVDSFLLDETIVLNPSLWPGNDCQPLLFQKAKGGGEALKDPEDTLNWMIELMDATLHRVDKAVDEGNKVVENYKKVNFQPRQVN
jgi:hypothetical protein